MKQKRRKTWKRGNERTMKRQTKKLMMVVVVRTFARSVAGLRSSAFIFMTLYRIHECMWWDFGSVCAVRNRIPCKNVQPCKSINWIWNTLFMKPLPSKHTNIYVPIPFTTTFCFSAAMPWLDQHDYDYLLDRYNGINDQWNFLIVRMKNESKKFENPKWKRHFLVKHLGTGNREPGTQINLKRNHITVCPFFFFIFN